MKTGRLPGEPLGKESVLVGGALGACLHGTWNNCVTKPVARARKFSAALGALSARTLFNNNSTQAMLSHLDDDSAGCLVAHGHIKKDFWVSLVGWLDARIAY